MDGEPIRNIATGEKHEALFEVKLKCLEFGGKLYEDFKQKRLYDKSQSIFSVIPRVKKVSRVAVKANDMTPINGKDEMESALKYINYAELRNHNISDILKHEILPIPLYLFNNDGTFRKKRP